MRRAGRKIKRYKAVILIIAAALALILGILLGISAGCKNGESSNKAADDWSSGGKFAQISLYLCDEANYNSDNIRSMRMSIESAVNSVSVNEGAGRFWYDCYSTEGRITVEGNDSSAECSVTAVGGDFFLMHSRTEGMSFISGSGFGGDELNDDRVVLDRAAAWRLFGSYDISGQYVEIQGNMFVVAGVADGVSDEPYLTPYGSRPRMYMGYDRYVGLCGDTPVSCYEAVLPNDIKDFALETVRDAAGLSEGEYIIKDVSSRFDFLPLCSTIASIGRRSMRTNRVVFPYWENAAGVTEDRMAVLLLFELIIGSMLALAAFIFIVRFLMTRKVSKDRVKEIVGLTWLGKKKGKQKTEID